MSDAKQVLWDSDGQPADYWHQPKAVRDRMDEIWKDAWWNKPKREVTK